METPTIEVISELSELAKLELSDIEKTSLVDQFSKLISFINQIEPASTAEAPTYSEHQLQQLRLDQVSQQRVITDPPTFQVPRIIP